uniref:Plakophilin 4 n=1 Tax=Paramormyrops kingsleyae TaxID=1676925 RepID=A0A3B3RFW7_9TELE
SSAPWEGSAGSAGSPHLVAAEASMGGGAAYSELQFERLTRELEAERQIVASQLEQCRLGAESPGGSSASSSEKSFPWRSADASVVGETKSRVTDSSQSPTYCTRSEADQASLYSPEQTSLHESEESAGNSRSSTQMNSYSDSGFQEACGYYSGQGAGKPELRLQHSYPGSGNSLGRGTRAEGQTSIQVHPAGSGRAMRRVSSVPSRTHSPAYGSAVSPSRGSLRTLLGSAYGSPVVAEPKPLAAVFSATTLPASQRPGSPASVRPGSAGRAASSSPYQAPARAGSPAATPGSSSPSPVRSGMTAVPQHYGSTLPRSLLHDGDLYAPRTYELYERMLPPRPDSLTGLQTSYASQHSLLGQDLRMAMSPDRNITPIYEGRTFPAPLFHSPNHGTVDLNHGSQSALYRTSSGMGNLQRTLSQHSAATYHKGGNYATYNEAYRHYRPSEPSYSRRAVAVDDGATRSPSIDSIQKDPREFAWRDPELPEVIHMLQHQFPSVQANAAAYLQHLCFGDNRVKSEVQGGGAFWLRLRERGATLGKGMVERRLIREGRGGVQPFWWILLIRNVTQAHVAWVLWNLSSCDAVKMTIIRDALSTLTNTVIIPHSGWSTSSLDEDHKLKFHSSLVLRNASGCLRNLSSAGEEARKQMRSCEGLVDSLLHVIKACVSTSDFDSKIVENCICTLRNLSYRLELEMPQSWLLGGQELDGLVSSESPSKDVDSSCWGKKKKKKKKKGSQDDQWDGVGPIPGFSKAPKGVEMLWHPAVVKPYLTLLAESSNPATLEGSAGSLQNLSAGNWKFAAYIRAAVRKEKGLPILVELLRMDNDRVVCSVATALRNMALDVRNKELIGKYAMRDLVNRLPGGGTTLLSDETVAAICCTLHEVTSKNMENAKALADTGGIEKLVSITKGRGERYSMKVVKAAAQVLNTLWQYRDLRTIYKKDGWNQNHFITPVSTLERDRYKSQPTLPSTNLQMSPVIQSASRKPSQYFTGSYSSPTREEPRRGQQLYYAEDPSRRTYDTYRRYLQSPRSYEDSYFEDGVHYSSTADYTPAPHSLKSTTNYVDFYSAARRPSYRAEQYPGSPDSWV